MIYINARFLTQPTTGVQRFAIEICHELLLQNDIDYILLAPKNLIHQNLAKEWNLQVIGTRSGHLWEQLELPLYLKKVGNPLLLNLGNTAPLYYKNNLVTIHDIAFIHNKNWFNWKFRLFYNFLIPKIAHSAIHIFTVSEFSKSEICSVLGIDPTSISVIYNAANKIFNPRAPNSSDKYTYILTVGSQDPRKNLNNSINAFLKAHRELNIKDLKLKIIGGCNSLFNYHSNKSQLGELDDKLIQFLGRVNDKELVKTLQGALAFIYPSLYEGFGLPNIEAMQCGVPVITSDIPVMHEVCKDAALYVNPNNIDDISKGIIMLVASQTSRNLLIEKGKRVATNYSWQQSATSLTQVLKKFLDAKE